MGTEDSAGKQHGAAGGMDTRAEASRRGGLSHAQRLHDPRDFERVYSVRKVVRTPKLVVFFCPNGLKTARLGVSVGRKHGNAVRRNRIKRVFRAAFRQSRAQLPGGLDYVLVPRQGVQGYTCAEIREILLESAKRIAALAH